MIILHSSLKFEVKHLHVILSLKLTRIYSVLLSVNSVLLSLSLTRRPKHEYEDIELEDGVPHVVEVGVNNTGASFTGKLNNYYTSRRA